MGTPQLDLRSEGQNVERPEGASSRMSAPNEPNQLHVNRVLWILFGLSIAFLIGVQIYVGRVENAAKAEATELTDLSLLETESPIVSVVPRELWLSWDSATGTTHYNLRIHSMRGIPVVDPVIVYETQWRPSDAVIPGLTPGKYRWTVEAMDSSGEKLAESATASFEIG